jgi:hypothetical protein
VGLSSFRRNAIFRKFVRDILEDYRLVWQSLRHPTRPASPRAHRVLIIWIIVFAIVSLVRHGWIVMP